jgi:hypothetical protein
LRGFYCLAEAGEARAPELADELQLLLASLREQTPGLFEGE